MRYRPRFLERKSFLGDAYHQRIHWLLRRLSHRAAQRRRHRSSRRNMKRGLSILLAAGLLACGGNSKPVGTSSDVHPKPPPPPGHPAPPLATHLVATITEG